MRASLAIPTLACALALLALGGVYVALRAPAANAAATATAEGRAGGAGAPGAAPTPDAPVVRLTDAQLAAVQVEPVVERDFEMEVEEVGSIDFNENLAVQVFPPYPGRILQTFADLGDEVKRGAVLFTIESPDFIQAQANLIGAAAALEQTSSALERARKLYADKALDQNDYETAVTNLRTAEGNLGAARHAVAIFGRTEAQIDRIIATREVETALVVKSPVSGRVTARNAAPGLLAQPGNPPAPFTVADLSTLWLVANVAEIDVPALRLGQQMSIRVVAYPGEVFRAEISALGTVLDPNTRRLVVRAAIRNPKHELLPGMFGSFRIRTGKPVSSPAVPLNGVVREGDGTMSVWVTNGDRHRFERRLVTIGLQAGGYRQILAGLRAGESVATDGAIFLSNIAYGGAS